MHPESAGAVQRIFSVWLEYFRFVNCVGQHSRFDIRTCRRSKCVEGFAIAEGTQIGSIVDHNESFA